MIREYVSQSGAFPGTVRVDEDGDLHVARVREDGYDDDAYVVLDPEDKLALANDLIESARKDLR